MPEKKKKKEKRVPASDASVLKKFLKTYEHHCVQSQSLASPTIRRGLQRCIENGKSYVKIVLSNPEERPDDSHHVLLKPLLMTIRDERYMSGTDLCVWGTPLSNQDVASLAILLELSGRTSYPFCRLDVPGCGIDPWSLRRLGRALSHSHLTALTLDYNEFQDEGVRSLVQALEGNKRLVSLSLCYCDLGPASGALLGNVVAQTAISELYLNGNHLQCAGAVDLITTIAEYAQSLAPEERPEVGIGLAHRILEGVHTAVSEGPADGGKDAVLPAPNFSKRKNRRKGSKRKQKAAPEPGPWVRKLHLADNGIDGRGEEGEIGVLGLTQLLSW
ncbi:hypothetical protein FKM82_003920 [Ascaphus truei]